MILMADKGYDLAGVEFDDTPPFDSDEQDDEEDAEDADEEDEDDKGVD